MAETCQECGKVHDVSWAADDATWLAVVGSPAGGFLCPGCFHRLAADKGIHIKWCANGPDCEDCHEENARLQAIVDAVHSAASKIAKDLPTVRPDQRVGRQSAAKELLRVIEAAEAAQENPDA